MNDTVPPVPIICACGNQICEEVYIEGIVLIHAGGGLWRALSGNCAQCGKAFLWSFKNKQLQQVIMRKKISPHDQEGDE
jgi:hypothetical protein